MLLSRALIETVFVLGALAQNAVTPEKLTSHDFAHRRKIANAVLPTVKAQGLVDKQQALESFIDEHTGSSTLGIETIATAAGMQDLYKTGLIATCRTLLPIHP